jgi:hypothetical protein
MRAVAFVDQAAHKAAVDFYRWCKCEPIPFGGSVGGYLYIESAVPYQTMNLVELTGDMLFKLSPGDGAIFVSHGNDHALIFRLARSGSRSLTQDNARTLSDYLDGRIEMSEREMARTLGIRDIVDFQALCDNLTDVRKKQFGHIALRACNLGKNGIGFLREMRRLFNCQSISGPMVKDAYIYWDTDYVARSVEEFADIVDDKQRGWLQKHGKAPLRTIFHVTQTPKQKEKHEFGIESLFEQRASLQAFLNDAYYSETPLKATFGATLPLHAFYYETLLIFPKQPEYLKIMLTWPAYTPIELPPLPPLQDKNPGLIERIISRSRERREARRAARA